MAPRGVEDRIAWFLTHRPDLDGDGQPDAGACANHSWKALGGDKGDPPRWGARTANQLFDKIRASGRYFTGPPPRGALVVWRYGAHGHAALSCGGGRIATTDPSAGAGRTGIEPLDYPTRWGASSTARIWTDTYNGVRFAVDQEDTVAIPRKALRPWAVGKQVLISRKGASQRVTLPGDKLTTVAIIDLPAGGRYACTAQVRMPKGVAAGEAVLARLGWGDAAKGERDETGGNPIPAASAFRRWRTPIEAHIIAGGGPLELRLWLPGSKPQPVEFVYKVVRLA